MVTEQQRELPVTGSCDVLVAGAGIAGVAAAISAARHGAKVTLLEREFTLGGLATLGLITIYLPLCDGEGNQVVFGIGEELFKLSILHGAEAGMYPKAWLEGGTKEERIQSRYITQFNPHLFALSAEKLLTELGVTILYGTLACELIKDGDKITHVVVENKSGRNAIAVKSVIDCTGDADLCKLAGVSTELHTGGNALASWYYYLSNGELKLKMFGLADVDPSASHSDNGNTYSANKPTTIGGMRFSGVDGAELSRANITARQMMYDDILKSRESDPELVPVTTPGIPEVRMSRRLSGAFTADVSSDHQHVETSIGMTGDWRKRGPVWELPYETLISDTVTNLLAAGRCVSVTDALWDVTRVIPPCAVTGQAAGVAAQMIAASGVSAAEVNIAQLQNALRSDGVVLHWNDLATTA